MQLKPNAYRLNETVKGVETMSRFALAVLALASGVYTYLGVRGLLDGSASFVFFAAVIYSVSVSVAMYGFWTFLIRFLPEMRDGGSRLSLVAIMVVGSAMIVAMSSWLNAAALAGITDSAGRRGRRSAAHRSSPGPGSSTRAARPGRAAGAWRCWRSRRRWRRGGAGRPGGLTRSCGRV